MSKKEEYDAMLQITGAVKDNKVKIRLTTDGETDWNQTRMLIIEMVYQITKFHNDLLQHSKKT